MFVLKNILSLINGFSKNSCYRYTTADPLFIQTLVGGINMTFSTVYVL